MSEYSRKTHTIADNLRAQLDDTGWKDVLRTFLVSQDFLAIIDRLVAFVEEDKLRFTPPLKQVFEPFVSCPWDKLKVVIVCEGPYQRLGIADGLALSAGNPDTSTPRELQRVLEAIQQEFKLKATGSTDLHRWSEQGVLLLNTSLTTQLERSSKHQLLWRPFLNYLLDQIQHLHPGVLFLLVGEGTWYLEDSMKPSNYYDLAEYPDTDTHAQTLTWNLGALNELLRKRGKAEIVW